MGIDELFFPKGRYVLSYYQDTLKLGEKIDLGIRGTYEVTAILTELIPGWNDRLGIPRKSWATRVFNSELMEME